MIPRGKCWEEERPTDFSGFCRCVYMCICVCVFTCAVCPSSRETPTCWLPFQYVCSCLPPTHTHKCIVLFRMNLEVAMLSYYRLLIFTLIKVKLWILHAHKDPCCGTTSDGEGLDFAHHQHWRSLRFPSALWDSARFSYPHGQGNHK